MVTFTDPLLANQWHFKLMGDINTIWNEYSGAGITVAVYDDGLQYTHPDLDGNYDASLHFVYDGVTYDPYPINLGTDGHGTSVAGIIAGEAGNGVGGVGVAWGATLTGVNFLSDERLWLDADIEAAAILYAANFDVMSNSWGYSPYFYSFLDRGDAASYGAFAESLLAQVMETGRDGLGTIIVKAAGNEAYNSNGEGLNGSRFIVDVAALTSTGQIQSYSNYGTNILISAGAAAVTTDLIGSNGYNSAAGTAGNYASNFGGTSAATPVVSGIVALMLDANEDLGWRDVREILATSAALTGSIVTGNQDYEVSGTYFQMNSRYDVATQTRYQDGDTWNDGGRGYSLDYGFGRVDAFAAVRMAEVWSLFGDAQTSANEDSISVEMSATQALTFNNQTYGRSILLEVDEAFRIENIDLTVTFYMSPANTTRELSITLQAPDGTYFPVVIFEDDLRPSQDGTSFSWTFGISQALGLNAVGDWRISFGMLTSAADLTINVTDLKLDFYGTAWDVDNVHHITKDYLLATSKNADGFRDKVITDTNGGNDWINMSSIAGAVTATLDGLGKILVAGVQWATIGAGTIIENIVTGDGSDKITGAALANEIHSMRGNDTIYGLGGDDTLNGGAGNDQLFGGGNNDLLIGEAGIDLLDGSTGDDTLEGGDGSDKLLGGDGNDVIIGDAGNDSAAGGTGNDLLDAGTGNDTLLGDAGDDFLSGGDGTDSLTAGTGNDSLYGGAGADKLFGGDGGDAADGGAGHDSISGGIGNDVLFGGADNDTLLGDAGDDTLAGGDGNDSLTGSIGNDSMTGGDGTDRLFGDDGNDAIFGDAGNDYLSGGNGNDVLNAGEGNDSVLGGNGDDILSGGAGNDVLTGGRQADSFVFRDNFGLDRITDFVDNTDTLVFGGDLWDGLMSVVDFVNAHATVSGSTVIFDFLDGNVLTVAGVNTLAKLYDDVTLLA